MSLDSNSYAEEDTNISIDYRPSKPDIDKLQSLSSLNSLFERAAGLGYSLSDSKVNLFVDRLEVLSPSDSSLTRPSDIPPELASEIEGILEDPYSFKGDLKIQVGSKTVYRNKDGDISINLLDLPGQRYTRNKNENNLEKIRSGS